jgi:hypothetical protein
MLLSSDAYCPLSVGNRWVYAQANGGTYANTITDLEPGAEGGFVMVNSLLKRPQHLRREGITYYADHFEAGNFQVLLREDLRIGDTWDISYHANGLHNILTMVVRDVNVVQQVNDVIYHNILILEGESKVSKDSGIVPLGILTRYYYARSIGLVFSEMLHEGKPLDQHTLVAVELKG